MATRMAFRYLPRRFSSSGRVLSEEEKAAENVYIKKTEQEKLEKLARKGPKPEEPATNSGSAKSISDAKPSAEKTSSRAGASTDKYRNYAVVAGTVTILGSLGWWYMSKDKKSKEVHE